MTMEDSEPPGIFLENETATEKAAKYSASY
jgi:hypothetical protein